MEANTLEKVESIFHNALELPFEQRKTFLQDQCAGNSKLLFEIVSLINSFEKDSYLLDEPVFEIGLGALGEKKRKNLADAVIGFYEIREKIGAGGMGEVYRAIDTRLNRTVALKFLSAGLEDDNQAKRRLVKEAQAVAMLDHPNICAVHGIEQIDEHHFIVMPFIEGKTLGESLKDKELTVEEFNIIAKQIISAVAFAHSHGVLHRDLKPGNIMLSESGQIKVLDFGLAKILQKNTGIEREPEHNSHFSQNGLVIGTVAYMSPEQLRGEKLDFRSDIFSVGIILYELIAKRNPFQCESQAETIAAVLSGEPAIIKETKPAFPASVIRFVEKCLQKKPSERFQSAAEMIVELSTNEIGNSVDSKSAKRQRIMVGSIFSVIILFTIFAFVFFQTSKRPPQTLAVLPITFDKSQIETEYMAGVLTRSIIEKLSNLSELKVKNIDSVEFYKGKNIEPQIAGNQLKVDAVYAGSISKRDDNFLLSTKLIRTTDGAVIAVEEFIVKESQLIESQETISKQIITKIRSSLTDEDKNKLAKKDTENEEAKRLYYRGLSSLNKQTESKDLEEAIKYFTAAKDLDRNYARAWTGLADAYLNLSSPGVERAITPAKAVESAAAAANLAMKLDNNLCDAYNSLALVQLKYGWNWIEAESKFRTAINCNREFIQARLGLIKLLSWEGRFNEALEEAKKIEEFDPLSVSSELEIAKIYYRMENYEQMDKILSDLLGRFPENKRIIYPRVYQFLITERYKEAIEILEKMYKSENQADKVFAAAPLGFAYAKTQQPAEALKIIKDLEKFRKKNYVPAQEQALIYAGLGDFNKVFENLNKSCEEKFLTLPGWVTDPLVRNVRADARFAAIKNCVNF